MTFFSPFFRSRNWKCPLCDISNIDILPDDNSNNNNNNNDHKNDSDKNSDIKNDKDVPLFSFTYEDDKKNNNHASPPKGKILDCYLSIS